MDAPPGESSTAEGLSGLRLACCALDLARRFEAGATLWCVAPGWPDHARHLAVEMVHPVVVGKRALPAVAVTDADPGPEVRDRSRPGDALVAISSHAGAEWIDLLRRARIWGLGTIWLGTAVGPPPHGAADHVLLCDDDSGLRGRQVVLAYHLLWELTQVCLEHPGLLGPPSGGEEVCVTCSDEGRMAEVVFVGPSGALVRSRRGREDVDLTVVPEVSAGDTVLVHAGVAIASAGAAPGVGSDMLMRGS